MLTGGRSVRRLALFGAAAALAGAGFVRAQNEAPPRMITAVVRTVAVAGDRVRLALANAEGVRSAVVSATKFETPQNRPFDPTELNIHDRLLIYLATPLDQASDVLLDGDIARIMVHHRPMRGYTPN